MNCRNTFIFFFTIAQLNCNSNFKNASQSFLLKGSLSDFKDSTLLFLERDSTLDSSFIINGKFTFKGHLKESIEKVLLRTKDSKTYKFFWLENSVVTFKAEKSKFRDAIISGSKTQDEQNQLDAAIKTSENEKEQNILFIRKHPNSIISGYILSVYASTWGKDTSTILYRTLSNKIKNSSDGKEILSFITLNKEIKIGDQYQNFIQYDIDDREVKLSSLAGKIILVEFWASWCAPCRRENPHLLNVYNKYRDKDFEIIAVSTDNDKNEWKRAIKEDQLTWLNVNGRKGLENEAALIYGVSFYPSNFLINKQGIIIKKNIGYKELAEELFKLIK